MDKHLVLDLSKQFVKNPLIPVPIQSKRVSDVYKETCDGNLIPQKKVGIGNFTYSEALGTKFLSYSLISSRSLNRSTS